MAFAVTEEGDAHINFKKRWQVGNRACCRIYVRRRTARTRCAHQIPDSYIKRESKLQANAKADPRRCTRA